MKGKFYINGVDAYVRYGVFVQQYGYKDLVQYPALKSVDSNSWPEEDGVEVDLSDPKLDTKQFNISFCRDMRVTIDEFLDVLGKAVYNDFRFVELGHSYRLRLVSHPSKSMLRNLEKFSLQFADDFPLLDYIYREPILCGVSQNQYEIDGKSFSDYGVWLLDGSDAEIEKSPAVKKNLLVNLNRKDGAIYYGEEVVFEAKDVDMKCLLKAPNLSVFWQNYEALLYDLVQPDEKKFYTERLGEEYPCYYKNASVSRFEILHSGVVWCEFTLTLVFTCFRVGELMYLLASEDNELIMLEELNEDGEPCYVDLKYYGD